MIKYRCTCGLVVAEPFTKMHEKGFWHKNWKMVLMLYEHGVSAAEIARRQRPRVSRALVAQYLRLTTRKANAGG